MDMRKTAKLLGAILGIVIALAIAVIFMPPFLPSVAMGAICPLIGQRAGLWLFDAVYKEED